MLRDPLVRIFPILAFGANKTFSLYTVEEKSVFCLSYAQMSKFPK